MALVRRFALQRTAAELMPEERIRACLRFLQSTTVQLWHEPTHQAGAVSGLQTCGSVWMCPCCATKVSERRREELRRGLERAEELGYRVVHVTYTVQHFGCDSLKGSLDGLLTARKRLLSGRRAKDFNGRYRVVGRVRALEVTYGANGWHPHVHELLIVEAGSDWRAMERELQARWSELVQAVGMRATNEHGVRVSYSDSAEGQLSIADYVSKFGRDRSWGPEHELTKQVVKMGRGRGSVAPVGLLAAAMGGSARAGRLWQEYARQFKGRRQLSWSDGLRELLGLAAEKSDQELSEELREHALFRGELQREDWHKVVGNDARAELLGVLGRGSVGELETFLWGLGIDPGYVTEGVADAVDECGEAGEAQGEGAEGAAGLPGADTGVLGCAGHRCRAGAVCLADEPPARGPDRGVGGAARPPGRPADHRVPAGGDKSSRPGGSGSGVTKCRGITSRSSCDPPVTLYTVELELG